MNRRKMNTSTSTCITSLSREILVKILTVLPPKSVVRFRCISKYFYSFIPKPHFEFKILVSLPSTTRPMNFYTVDYTEESQGKLQADSVQCLDEAVKRFEGSVDLRFADGMICVFSNFGETAVCDLSTTDHVSPPTPNFCFGCAALGFDSVSKRYKVLKSEKHGNFRGSLKVLTLGVDESWREIIVNSSCSPGEPDDSVHIDDIIYLIDFNTKPNIFAFDVRTENLSAIPFPCKLQPCFLPSQFASPWIKLNGRLTFIYICVKDRRCKIDICTLEKSMKGKKHKVALPLEEAKIISQANSMGFTSNSVGEIVVLIRVMKMSPLILLYAFGRQVWRKFEICGLYNYSPILKDSYRSLVHLIEEGVSFPK